MESTLTEQSNDLLRRYSIVPECSQESLYNGIRNGIIPSFLGNFGGAAGDALGNTVNTIVDAAKGKYTRDTNNASRLISYMNPKTPVRRILLYHPVGSGKTRKALMVAAQYGRSITVVIVHRDQQIPFERELESCSSLIRLYPEYRISTEYVTCSILDKAVKGGDNYLLDYYFKDRVAIIDEAHHARSKGEDERSSNSIFRSITDILSRYLDTIVLFLSATPIVDQAEEIDGVYRLLTCKSSYTLLEDDITLKSTNVAAADKLGGYVSVIGNKGPNAAYKYIQELDLPITLKHVQCRMVEGGPQDIRYSEFRGRSDAVHSFTRAISRFTTTEGTNAEQMQESIESIVSKDPAIAEADNITQLNYLARYSIKYYVLARQMLDAVGKVKFIYDSWKERGGAIRLVQFLTSSNVGYQEITTVADALRPGGRKLLALHRFAKDTNTLQTLLEIAGSEANKDAELIESIIATPKYAESISITNAKIVYIMEQPWNNPTLEQIIGRANRRNSLRYETDPSTRFIDVRILELRHPDGQPTIEHTIRLSAEAKYRSIQPVVRKLVEVSLERLPLSKTGKCPLRLFPHNVSQLNNYVRKCRNTISHRGLELDISTFMNILNSSVNFYVAMQRVTELYGGGRYVATVIHAIEHTYIRRLQGDTLTLREEEMLKVCMTDTMRIVNGTVYHMLYFVNLDTTEYQRLAPMSKCVLRELDEKGLGWSDYADEVLIEDFYRWYESKVTTFETNIRDRWEHIGYYLIQFAMPPCVRLIEYKDQRKLAAKADPNREDKRKRPRGEKHLYYSKGVMLDIMSRYTHKPVTQLQAILRFLTSGRKVTKERIYGYILPRMIESGLYMTLPI